MVTRAPPLRRGGQPLTLRLIRRDPIIANPHILSREKAPLSMRPKGFLPALPPLEVRDGLASLRTPAQVPVPVPGTFRPTMSSLHRTREPAEYMS
jgi:hypothetical protein